MVKANTVNPVKSEAPEAVPARLAVRDGVLAVVGDTPLVELTRVYPGFGGHLLELRERQAGGLPRREGRPVL